MNEENWYQDYEDPGRPADPDAAASKPGMSTGMKVLIGVLIAAGVMLLLCCGGTVFVVSRLMNMATDDPARIQEIKEEIAGIDLPEEWKPVDGVDGELFGFEMESVKYENGESALILIQVNMPGMAGEVSQEQIREQFEQSMRQRGQSSDINVESKEERTLTVAGEEITLEFVKGTTQNGEEVRQVTGTFSGRGGPALLFYRTPEEDWDEEQAVELIESIEK